MIMRSRKGIVFTLSLAILCSGLINNTLPVSAEVLKANPKSTVEQILNEQTEDGNDYFRYIKQLPDNKPQEKVVLEAGSVIAEKNARLEAVESDSFIRVQDGGRISWKASIPQEGQYRMKIRYRYCDDLRITNSSLAIYVNGAIPFSQAENIELNRLWKDASKIMQDANGNDVRPAQKQLLETAEEEITDKAGYVRELYFNLRQGLNEVAMEFNGADAYIESVTFFNEKTVSYEDYIKNKNIQTSVNYHQMIQAEEMLMKNDSALTSSMDRTGPATIPSDPVKRRRNILNGNAYRLPGQIVSYEFTVPQDGYYKLGIRARQNQSENLAAYRRITIDNKLLFSEMESMSIAYSERWGFYRFGGEEPYLFYLEKGRHSVSFEVVAGTNGRLAKRLEDAVYVMNALYRKIIMITSTEPDYYRDYNLEKEIPELIPAYKELIVELNDLVREIEKTTNQKGGQASILMQMAVQLEEFVEDSAVITDRLKSYESNIAAVSSLLLTLLEQPLSMDYIVIMSEDYEMKDTEAGFFENLMFQVKAFIGSFFHDYKFIGSGSKESQTEAIRVWFNGGREQAEIFKQLVDDEFTPKYGIGVKLELVQVTLTQAILAGVAPDVVMNVARTQPVNLAARDVVMELSQFEGFDEMSGWFNKDAYRPYTYRNKVYGLPVTMEYHAMFYRKDILKELNLSVPETWEELYAMIPVIQRANMRVGLPYTVMTGMTGAQYTNLAMTSQAAFDSGMGAKDIFPTLLLQKGGRFYNDDLTKVTLDSPGALSAFKEYTEFYTKYGFDLEYNFYNRFRTGEIPIGIQSYNIYNQLKEMAPEIKGLWDIATIPGTLREDGTIDKTEAAQGSASVMMKDTSNPEASWKFMKWWASAEAQTAYGLELETLMGTAARYTPANLQALEQLPWSKKELAVIKEQMSHVKEIPEVVGGYYTSRGIDNAFRSVLFDKQNYRESILEQIMKINDELERKRNEEGIR